MNNYKYKITTIIPIYNVKKYLEAAIKSIIRQTIGFKNIELILINDGSPYGEEDICKKYEKKYNNVTYIYQKNKGVSAARNAGINIATGKYISFLDPDDKLEKNAYYEGIKMLEDNSEINFITYRQKFFEAGKGYHAIDYKFDKGNRIVDILKDYEAIQLSAAASLIRSSALKNIRFDENVKLSEDAKFMTDVLFKNDSKKYGLIKTSNYLYRRRRVRNSSIQTSILDKTWYSFTSKNVYEYVFNLSKEVYGKVIPYAQYFVMYHLKNKLSTKIGLDISQEERTEHDECLKKLLKSIDDNIILEQMNYNIDDKIFALNIKYDKDMQNSIKVCNDNIMYKKNIVDSLSNYKIKINNIKENNNKYILYFSILNFLDLKNLNVTANNKKVGFKVRDKDFSIYEHFREYAPKEKELIIEISKKQKNIITFLYNDMPLCVQGEALLLLLNCPCGQFRINKYSISTNENKVIISHPSFETFLKSCRYDIYLLLTNRNAYILNFLYYFSKPFCKNINILYLNENSKIKLLNYFKEKNIDTSSFIIIDKKNKKFINNRSLEFKLKYLNSKNIYFDINEITPNPFGKASRHYINKINATYNIFVDKDTPKEMISLYNNSYKNVKFIKKNN